MEPTPSSERGTPPPAEADRWAARGAAVPAQRQPGQDGEGPGRDNPEGAPAASPWQAPAGPYQPDPRASAPGSDPDWRDALPTGQRFPGWSEAAGAAPTGPQPGGPPPAGRAGGAEDPGSGAPDDGTPGAQIYVFESRRPAPPAAPAAPAGPTGRASVVPVEPPPVPGGWAEPPPESPRPTALSAFPRYASPPPGAPVRHPGPQTVRWDAPTGDRRQAAPTSADRRAAGPPTAERREPAAPADRPTEAYVAPGHPATAEAPATQPPSWQPGPADSGTGDHGRPQPWAAAAGTEAPHPFGAPDPSPPGVEPGAVAAPGFGAPAQPPPWDRAAAFGPAPDHPADYPADPPPYRPAVDTAAPASTGPAPTRYGPGPAGQAAGPVSPDGPGSRGHELGGHELDHRDPTGQQLGGRGAETHELGGHDLGGHDLPGDDLSGHDLSGRDEGGHDLGGHDPGGHDLDGHELGGHDLSGHELGGRDAAGPAAGQSAVGDRLAGQDPGGAQPVWHSADPPWADTADRQDDSAAAGPPDPAPQWRSEPEPSGYPADGGSQRWTLDHPADGDGVGAPAAADRMADDHGYPQSERVGSWTPGDDPDPAYRAGGAAGGFAGDQPAAGTRYSESDDVVTLQEEPQPVYTETESTPTADTAPYPRTDRDPAGLNGRVPGPALRPGDVTETRLAVWSEERAAQIRADWHEVKALFVDEPTEALAKAGALITAAVDEVTAALLAEQERLNPLRESETPDTETMRIAMRRFREFLDRILEL